MPGTPLPSASATRALMSVVRRPPTQRAVSWNPSDAGAPGTTVTTPVIARRLAQGTGHHQDDRLAAGVGLGDAPHALVELEAGDQQLARARLLRDGIEDDDLGQAVDVLHHGAGVVHHAHREREGLARDHLRGVDLRLDVEAALDGAHLGVRAVDVGVAQVVELQELVARGGELERKLGRAVGQGEGRRDGGQGIGAFHLR